MPFFDTGELFSIGGLTIRIGVNALAILMGLVAVFGIIGLLNSMKAKNILAAAFSAIQFWSLDFGRLQLYLHSAIRISVN